ncbi:hypothetical protein ACGFJC_47225 [Nonomuraea fuscirosea]|uniref:hypothetical protein n=1 Tax=Nonomuraea fuscirosea TaxID=1291556 RepID=UPI003716D1A3
MPADHDGDAERHPTPTADDLTGAQVGSIAFSSVLRLLADNATTLVPTTVQRRRGTAGRTRATVEMRRILNELMDRAITADLGEGATWPELAAALGVDPEIAVLRYAHLDWQHLDDDAHATWAQYHRSCPEQLHDFCPSDPAVAARQLDTWYEHHADPRDPAPAPTRAVTAGL